MLAPDAAARGARSAGWETCDECGAPAARWEIAPCGLTFCDDVDAGQVCLYRHQLGEGLYPGCDDCRKAAP